MTLMDPLRKFIEGMPVRSDLVSVDCYVYDPCRGVIPPIVNLYPEVIGEVRGHPMRVKQKKSATSSVCACVCVCNSFCTHSCSFERPV